MDRKAGYWTVGEGLQLRTGRKAQKHIHRAESEKSFWSLTLGHEEGFQICDPGITPPSCLLVPFSEILGKITHTHRLSFLILPHPHLIVGLFRLHLDPEE